MSKLRRIGLQAPLGFASGLPLLLTRRTLATWLGYVGVDVKAAAAFSLIALPYNLKILWAPLLDRFRLPWLDRRRDWMVALQVLLIASIVLLGSLDPVTALGTVAVVAFVVAFVSASHDIVIDAYRTDLLRPDERGRATGLYVAGYRVGMIAASALALLLADWSSWQVAYSLIAALLLVGTAATLAGPRLDSQTRPKTVRAAFVDPLREFAQRPGAGVAFAFILLYKLGDTVTAPMVSFFLPTVDYSLTQIALVEKGFGLAATIIGALLGGVLTDKLGMRRGLLLFGIAQAAANVGYVGIALTGPTTGGLIAAIGIDNLCNGFGTAAFVAFLMSLCHHKFSATQYALFTSASTLLGHLFGAGAGVVVETIGWPGFFLATIAVAVPALLLIPWLPTDATAHQKQ